MNKPFTPEFLYLTQEDVIEAGALDMAAAQEDVEIAYKLFSSGQVNQPHKPIFNFDNKETGQKQYYLAVSMPVYVGGKVDAIGHKWAAESMGNAKRGDMPMGIDIILLHDLEHAIPYAIMEGGLITAMRTSAVAGVGAKYLARQDSKIAGLIGAGVIGRTMVIVVDSVEDAFRDADIITTQTTARSPIVEDKWVPQGSYYAHMSRTEGEDAVFLNTDRLVVDNWATLQTWDHFPVTRLHTDGKIDEDEISDIGDILLGKKPARIRADERILFANLGMGCLDITMANRIYLSAKEKGLGQKLKLWEKPLWI